MRALLIILVAALTACGDGKREAAEVLAAMVADSTQLLVGLERFDVPLRLALGERSVLGVDSAQVRWNEEVGWLEVVAGEHCGLVVVEEPGDLSRLKRDLDQDPLQTHAILKDSTDRLVWRSQFPDDALVFLHFCRVVESAGRTFVLRDLPSGRYNEADVQRMLAAVRTVGPA
jgi:hypothetical protein